MKYIGTVIDTHERKQRAETIICIEGLARPQQIVVIWSIPRSPSALAELHPGTRVIFAAFEDTLTQRTDTDETTGATATVLVAVGHFFDVIDDPRDAADIYQSIETRDLEFTGTVTDTDTSGASLEVTLAMSRHSHHQALATRWPAGVADTITDAGVGDEVTITAAERSLTWKIHFDDHGRRAIVPVVTATGVIGAPRATSASS